MRDRFPFDYENRYPRRYSNEVDSLGCLRELILIITILSAAGLWWFGKSFLFGKNTKSVDLTRQIENLERISNDVNNLQSFIEDQKKSLVAENKAIEALKSEKESLEPLVQADRDAIEAIFKQQEKRQNSQVWTERLFGFFAGVISSILASYIFEFLYRKKRKKKQSAVSWDEPQN